MTTRRLCATGGLPRWLRFDDAPGLAAVSCPLRARGHRRRAGALGPCDAARPGGGHVQVSPTSGPVGTTITVNGSGLQLTARMYVYFECFTALGGGLSSLKGSVQATPGGTAQFTFVVTATDLENQNSPPPCPFTVAVNEVTLGPGPFFRQPFTITGSAPTSTTTPTATPTATTTPTPTGTVVPLECTNPSFFFPTELPQGGSAFLQAGGFQSGANVAISLTGPQG